MKEKKLTGGYYIFTNNNSALHRISSIMKTDSIVMYEDPDDVFLTNNTKNNNYLTLCASFEEVDQINKSELVLLHEYLTASKKDTKFDDSLAYIAFATTIRNLKSVILEKFSNLEINFSGTFSKRLFNSECKQIIEHLYMHYDPGYSGAPSNSATLADVFSLYNYLINIKNVYVNSCKSNANSFVAERSFQCKKPFSVHTGNKMIALVFKKIIFVSELKYEFEEVLLDKLEHKFGFKKSDIDSIANCNYGFMEKVRTARRIDNRTGHLASVFLDDVVKVHKENCELVNEFDHALGLMYPPYLNTRIFDIKKYKNGIERINSTY